MTKTNHKKTVIKRNQRRKQHKGSPAANKQKQQAHKQEEQIQIDELTTQFQQECALTSFPNIKIIDNEPQQLTLQSAPTITSNNTQKYEELDLQKCVSEDDSVESMEVGELSKEDSLIMMNQSFEFPGQPQVHPLQQHMSHFPFTSPGFYNEMNLTPDIGACFAGFSPSNNLYEDEFDFNNSFDDPFNADFIDDNDFETFSFNDTEEIFDKHGHNDEDEETINNYSTSETETSDDEAKRNSDHFTLQRSISNTADTFSNNYYNTDNFSGDESNDFEEYNENESFDHEYHKNVRISKSLDSFPNSPKHIFTPNRNIKPIKSSFKSPTKVSSPEEKLTFIVSAENGNTRDATRYATELNSDNGRGIPYPLDTESKIFIPANQTQRNRKKHKKAAVIHAKPININNQETPLPLSFSKHVGFYSESSLRAYLKTKTSYSNHIHRSNFKDSFNGFSILNDTIGEHKSLRKYNSSIQLNETKNIPTAIFKDSTNLLQSHRQKDGKSKKGIREVTKTTKKSVKWAHKLEW